MNLFELMFLFLFTGGGAIIGSQAAGLTGGIVGAVSGYGLLYLLVYLSDLDDRSYPPCDCNGKSDYESEYIEPIGLVRRCNDCSAQYTQRRGSEWYAVQENGELMLRYRRKFPGGWKDCST